MLYTCSIWINAHVHLCVCSDRLSSLKELRFVPFLLLLIENKIPILNFKILLLNSRLKMEAENAISNSSTSIEILSNLSSFLTHDFEPVGKWFEQYTYLRHLGDAEEVLDESSSESEDEVVVEDTPEYLAYLQSLDPKEWKEQDHYKVLGIEKLRHKATAHQIKKAYKRCVLNHHPDKSKNKSAGNKDNNEYFNCITRAFEQLSNPVKRMSYDSCDPEFDDSVPAVNDKNKKNFFKVFGKVFEENSRWSNKKKLPAFGDENSTFADINEFYGFWYEFDSWREFSYKDEESKETATDRDERRWIDKQNKGARLKLKKEEVIRVRKLVGKFILASFVTIS